MVRERRLSVVHGALLLFAIALVARSGFVQLWQGAKWDARAERQQVSRDTLAAPRGEILDLAGVPLAESQVHVQLAIVPGEVREPRRLARSLQHLGVDAATLRRVADQKRKWVPVGGTFAPSDVNALRVMPGVHATDVGQRSYLPSDGLRKIVGRTGPGGVAIDGIELALDSLLRGERGTAAALLDARGTRYESPEMLTAPPLGGHSITLTVSYVVQDICDRALADATERLSATGGDIVVLDPRDGEIRCLASRRSGQIATASTALTEPFEPGSTLKPLYAGRLIESGKARVSDVIETFNGVYRTHGRTINDVHKAERLSLADVIRFSSNVGIVRFTERLSPREMYETLRDFGFGTPTGVTYPSEAPGILHEPATWSAQSQASLAIGYEVAVTPLQLATAYAALANGGRLLDPALIREIRDPDGALVYTHRPSLVRQVLGPETTRTLRQILATVVDSGTATEAGLSSFEFGGKSGTARRSAGGTYGRGSYTSLFVGLFPAEAPQYVVLVKIDNPQGSYYGGKAAAPVAKAVVEAAIAARDAALDRSSLALQKAPYVPPDIDRGPTAQVASTGRSAPGMVESPSADDSVNPPRAEADSPIPGGASTGVAADGICCPPARFDIGRFAPDTASSSDHVVVPDVREFPLRAAVRELHRAGLRVVLVAGGPPMTPPPGTAVARGSLVRLGRP
jgi:cell division protein FtsI (penicillin-binding protein 3)